MSCLVQCGCVQCGMSAFPLSLLCVYTLRNSITCQFRSAGQLYVTFCPHGPCVHMQESQESMSWSWWPCLYVEAGYNVSDTSLSSMKKGCLYQKAINKNKAINSAYDKVLGHDVQVFSSLTGHLTHLTGHWVSSIDLGHPILDRSFCPDKKKFDRAFGSFDLGNVLCPAVIISPASIHCMMPTSIWTSPVNQNVH